MARQETANTLINRAALELGVGTDSDPVASSHEAFVQLTGLLNAVGQELVELRAWQVLRQEIDFTVDSGSALVALGDGVTVGPNGVYTLPDNFGYMIDQTGWDRTNDNPMGGPSSAQIWTAKVASAVTSTIYIDFRIAENKLYCYPTPLADSLNVTFEYINRYWVQASGESAPNADVISAGSDTVLFEPIMVVKMLKVKFLEAKGMDASAARLELDTLYNARSGRDEGAGILSAGGRRRYPFITACNAGDTGYGS